MTVQLKRLTPSKLWPTGGWLCRRCHRTWRSQSAYLRTSYDKSTSTHSSSCFLYLVRSSPICTKLNGRLRFSYAADILLGLGNFFKMCDFQALMCDFRPRGCDFSKNGAIPSVSCAPPIIFQHISPITIHPRCIGRAGEMYLRHGINFLINRSGFI